MSSSIRLIRFIAGFLILAVVLILLSGFVLKIIPTWGASPEEISQRFPAELAVPESVNRMTHAITIDAPPEVVWAWVAQIGDTKAGYYSYTWIENNLAPLFAADTGYSVVYRNADRIVPEWGNPQPGDSLIEGLLEVAAVEPGVYLAAESSIPETIRWWWSWELFPLNGGAQTRLVERLAMQPGGTASANPVMDFFLGTGAFVMEQRMLQGIKLRAEGGQEPVWLETAELLLLGVTLVNGLAAAVVFVLRRPWKISLLIAVLSVPAFYALLVIQPPFLVRTVMVVVLIAGLAAALWQARTSGHASVQTPRLGWQTH